MPTRRVRLVPRTPYIGTPVGEELAYQSGTATAGLSGGWYPNEPAGYTPLQGTGWDGFTFSAAATGLSNTGNITYGVDATATYTTTLGVSITPGMPPKSGPLVGRNRMAQNFGSPTSGRASGMWFCSASGKGWHYIYQSVRFQFPSNWYGHTFSPGVCKFLQPRLGSPSGNLLIIGVIGQGTNALRLGVGYQGALTYNGGLSAAGTGYLTPNTGVGATADDIIRGQWHHVEYLCRANSAGTEDGTLDIWLDGVHLFQHTNQLASGGSTWGQQDITNVYGGTGDVPNPDSQDILVDHWYLSGKV